MNIKVALSNINPYTFTFRKSQDISKHNNLEKTHEKDVFENVTKARSGLMNAGSVKEVSEANNALTGALTSLFAIAENYPELKADQNFKELQSELTETEDKISYSRQFYNDAVLMYNNKCEQFPSNIIAGMFNFKEADFFEIASGEREAPKVQF